MENDISRAPKGCRAVIEFSNQDGSASGTVPCPKNGQCALEYLNNEGYRTDDFGECALNIKPKGSAGQAQHN